MTTHELIWGEVYQSWSDEELVRAVDRLTSEGEWYLWVVELQTELGGLYDREPDVVLANGFRRYPYLREWAEREGISSLDCGHAFVMTRGSKPLSEDEFAGLMSMLKLPEGIDGALVFDPDLMSFDAIFVPELFDHALRQVQSPQQ